MSRMSLFTSCLGLKLFLDLWCASTIWRAGTHLTLPGDRWHICIEQANGRALIDETDSISAQLPLTFADDAAESTWLYESAPAFEAESFSIPLGPRGGRPA